MPLRLLAGYPSDTTGTTYAFSNLQMRSMVETAILSGRATHIRFYSRNAATGVSRLAVFESTGVSPYDGSVRIAQTSLVDSLSFDWNTVELESPVDITLGDEYLVGGVTSSQAIAFTIYGASDATAVSNNLADLTIPSSFPSGGNVSANTNWKNLIQVLGWIDPTISTVNDGNILYDGQSIPITGLDLMDSGATVELSDSATYGAGTLVEQTVTAQDDENLQVTVDFGSLTPGSTAYLYVTTDAGLRTAAFTVSLSAVPLVGNAVGEQQPNEGESQSGSTNGVILGNSIEETDNTYSSTGSLIVADRFQATATADGVSIGLLSVSTAPIKVALYDDSNNLLDSIETTAISGKNYFDLSPAQSLVSGTYYWAVVVVDATFGVRRQYKAGSEHYEHAAPADFDTYEFPSTYDWTPGTLNSAASLAVQVLDIAPYLVGLNITSGDSLSNAEVTRWGWQLPPVENNYADYHLLGNAGYQTGQWLGQLSSSELLITIPSAGQKKCFVMIGTNDLVFNPNEGISATMYANFASGIASLVSHGYDVYVCTVPKIGGDDATQEAERVLYNNLIKSNAESLGIAGVSDIDTIDEFSDPDNLLYYNADGIHHTPYGSSAMAALIAKTARIRGKFIGDIFYSGTFFQKSANYQFLSNFKAPVNCRIDRLSVYSEVAGNFKIAIYSGTQTTPGSLIYAFDTPVPAYAGQWNHAFIPNYISIADGSWYWISAIADTAGVITSRTGIDSGFRIAERADAFDTFEAPETLTGLTEGTSQTIRVYASGIERDGFITHVGESAEDESAALLSGVTTHAGTSVQDASDAIVFGDTKHSGVSIIDAASASALGITGHSGVSVRDAGNIIAAGLTRHSGLSAQDTSSALVAGYVEHAGESSEDVSSSVLLGVTRHAGLSAADEALFALLGLTAHSGESAVDTSAARLGRDIAPIRVMRFTIKGQDYRLILR